MAPGVPNGPSSPASAGAGPFDDVAAVGGRYGGLPTSHRLASAGAMAVVLAVLGWLMLSAGRIAPRPAGVRHAALRLFTVRPPPPPPVRPPPPSRRPPPPQHRHAGGASPRRPVARPPAPDPIIAAPLPTPLALAAPAPLEAAPATLTGLDGTGGAGSGAGAGDGAGDGAGGPAGIRYGRADWVRRPDRRAFDRYWPKAVPRLRRPLPVLLACHVDRGLHPFGCTVLSSRWTDPAYGRAALAIMADTLIRPVTRNGRPTDLPVLVTILFQPDR